MLDWCIKDKNVHTKNIDEITKKYEMPPSILEIKKNVNAENKFLFINKTANAFKDEISKTDLIKAV